MIGLHEKRRFSVDFGDDESILMAFKYIGSQVSGTIDIASTGDITAKHGASGSEVADTTVNPDGDTPGTLDLYGGTLDSFPTYKSIMDCFNLSANWECWLEGALPDAAPFTTTTGHFTEVTGGAAKVTGGYKAKTDDSDSLYIVAGLTYKQDPTMGHFTDHQVAHFVQRVIALSTYGSGTSNIYIYACDDEAGTKELLKELTAGVSTTEVAYPLETYVLPEDAVLAQANGKRIVVQLINSAALGTVRLKVEGYMYIIGPAVRKAALWSELSC